MQGGNWNSSLSHKFSVLCLHKFPHSELDLNKHIEIRTKVEIIKWKQEMKSIQNELSLCAANGKIFNYTLDWIPWFCCEFSSSMRTLLPKCVDFGAQNIHPAKLYFF